MRGMRLLRICLMKYMRLSMDLIYSKMTLNMMPMMMIEAAKKEAAIARAAMNSVTQNSGD
jgi:hypothetical protein